MQRIWVTITSSAPEAQITTVVSRSVAGRFAERG
jgi:hypothetical protein